MNVLSPSLGMSLLVSRLPKTKKDAKAVAVTANVGVEAAEARAAVKRRDVEMVHAVEVLSDRYGAHSEDWRYFVMGTDGALKIA